MRSAVETPVPFRSARSKWPALLAVAVLFAGGLYFFNRLGHAHGDASRQRLETIWPSLTVLQPKDQALVGALAFGCQLHTMPLDRAATIACLRHGVISSSTRLPNGLDRAQATLQLERLLENAPASPR